MQMLTPKDVAKQLQVCQRTITRLIAKGDLKFKKIGGQLRITQDELLLCIDKMQEPKEPIRRTRTRKTTQHIPLVPVSYTNGRPNYV